MCLICLCIVCSVRVVQIDTAAENEGEVWIPVKPVSEMS